MLFKDIIKKLEALEALEVNHSAANSNTIAIVTVILISIDFIHWSYPQLPQMTTTMI